jgi:hypothetical protein
VTLSGGCWQTMSLLAVPGTEPLQNFKYTINRAIGYAVPKADG